MKQQEKKQQTGQSSMTMPVGLSLEQIEGFESLECYCGNDEFSDVMKIKKLPAVLSPTGQPGIVRMQFLRCTKCRAEMNPVTGISKEENGEEGQQ